MTQKWNGQITDNTTRREAKLHAILAAAAGAFMGKGYHQTSLDDIAKNQNVTKPTLYYYIKNKEDILVKCEGVAKIRINGMIDDILDQDKSSFLKLQDFIHYYVDLVMDDIIRCHIHHRGQMKEPEAKKNSLKMHREIEHRIRKLILEAINDGSMRSCNPTIIAILIFDTLNGISAWYREDGELNKNELKKEVLKLLTDGLKP